MSYRSLRDGLVADVGRAISMAATGAVAFAPVEYALTLATYAGPIGFASKLRLAALALALALWLWLGLAIVTGVVLAAGRLARQVFDPAAARDRGWCSPRPPSDGVRPGVPRLWALLATVGTAGLLVQRATLWASVHFQERELTSIVIALFAIVAFALAVPLRRVFGVASELAAAALAPMLGIANPLGRWRAAAFAWTALVGAAFAACWYVLPQSRSVLPVRLAISAAAIALGMGYGALLHPRLRRRRRKRTALAIAAVACALEVMTLWKWGADVEAKYVAITASPAFDQLIKLVRAANDLDRDGFGSLLGENDCAPLDGSIHPGAIDLPDDGIDQNCDGRDFSLRPAPAPTGPQLAVPAEFKRDWNILFITIDTVRYDHTTFGGYKDSPKKRDTTPRLAEFVKRSTSFTFCNAPSAGTMASIPAILTSKFFHSGIALDETPKPGNPPRIKPENTTLPEIMKRGGYHTGVIASHHWWNDWGMEQGVDDYDNSIGKRDDPFIVAADKVTDHIIAWVSRQQGHKWFLWAHYIDPHGRYVAHPDVVNYGSTEPDLYDAEIAWTDQQIGRLFDELVRLPSNDNTIIIITSDHGESMGEHTVPVGTHGTALYFELLHTPLVVYVPNNRPRQVGGAVSSLDIVPTIAELANIDVHDLSFEGRSLVPQIFYGKEDHERIVFSETNAPTPLRAAISEAYKLIFNVQANLYELYDLRVDPGEKTNLATGSPPALAQMKAALDDWLERVVYARDPKFNQATKMMADLVLPGPPKPPVTTAQTLDTFDILGIGFADKTPHATAGSRVEIHVYFHVRERTHASYRFTLVVWPVDASTWKPSDPPPTATRSPGHVPGEGLFPTDRWRANEYIRERFAVAIPADWHGNALAVALESSADANHPTTIVLGTLPFGSSGSAAP